MAQDGAGATADDGPSRKSAPTYIQYNDFLRRLVVLHLALDAVSQVEYRNGHGRVPFVGHEDFVRDSDGARKALVFFFDLLSDFWAGAVERRRADEASGPDWWARELDRLWPAVMAIAERLEKDGEVTDDTVDAALHTLRMATGGGEPPTADHFGVEDGDER